MNKRFAFLLTFLILVPLILAACGGDDEDDGGSGGGEVSLGQSFETTQENVTLAFDYPDEWVTLEQEGNVAIASSQDVAESLTGDGIPELGDDDAGMIFFPFPAVMLQLEGDAEAISAGAAIDSFGGQMIAEEDEFSLGENQEATFNGKPAARATISGDIANGEMFVIESSEEFFTFVVYVGGEYDDGARATVESILNSAELTVSE